MTTFDPTLHTFRPEGPPADSRGGFYVSVIDGDRYILALGPFETHDEAETNVERVRKYVGEHDRKGWWYGYGTSRALDPPYALGKLNLELGVVVVTR